MKKIRTELKAQLDGTKAEVKTQARAIRDETFDELRGRPSRRTGGR